MRAIVPWTAMGVDPNNPVVKLCAAGISAEIAGRRDEAAKLYQDAWDMKADDFEACVAAHYMARLQTTPRAALHWNAEALRFAQQASDEGLREFFPSLYLNLGKAYEDLENFADAKKFYLLAEANVDVLPADQYAETVKRGVRKALERLASAEESRAHRA